MFDLFLRGILMDEAGGADGGGGAMTMADTGGGTDPGTDLATVDDSGGGDVVDAEVVDDAATDADIEPYQVFEGRQPSKATRTALGTLKATHPKVHKAMYDTLAYRQRVERATGGADPVAVITGLKQEVAAYREAGLPFGVKSAADVAQWLKEIDELDDLFLKGDPQMVERLTSEPEGKANFVKLGPSMLRKLRELAPKMHDAHVARTVLATMDTPSFDIQTAAGPQKISATRALERAIEYGAQKIGEADNPALPYLNILAKFWNNLIGIEQQQPEDLTPAATGPDPRQAELDRREREINERQEREKITEWKKGSDAAITATFRSEFAKQRKARGLKEGLAPEIEVFSIVEGKVRAALTQSPGYKDKIDAYYSANDKDGYLRLRNSKYAELMPVKMAEYFNAMYGPAKGAAARPGTQQQQQRTTTTVKPEQGFRAVNKKPNTNDIDISAMRNAGIMTMSTGKAILKDGNSFGLPGGTKVKWA